MKIAYSILCLAALVLGGRFLAEFTSAVRESRESSVQAASTLASNRAVLSEGTQPRIKDTSTARIQLIPYHDTPLVAAVAPEPESELTGTEPKRHPGPVHDTYILPGNFEYLGAIRPPHVEDLTSKFSWGGAVVAFNPHGDPEGDDDGFPGSLYLSGHVYDQQVAELSIPQPVISSFSSLDDLSVARVLQPFGDITDGTIRAMTKDDSQPFQLGGLQVTGRTLHWTIFRYYNVEGYDFLSHGVSSLSTRKPFPGGPWHLGPYQSSESQWHAYKHAGYICDVPTDVTIALGNRNMLSGLQISTGLQTSSQGPALFAYQLPPGTTPVGASLDAVPLLWYSLEEPLPGHHPADLWTGAAWLTLNGKQTVMFTGRKATGPVHYGVGRPQDCNENNGYHGPPYEGQAIFYAADDLLEVARRQKNAWEVQPVARWTSQTKGGGLIRYLFPTCEQELGGLAYDRKSNLLYLVQLGAGTTEDSPFEPLPIIHVFRVVS